MDIQAISDAATIAIACAIIFLIVAKSWQRLADVFSGAPNFADSIMSEAAQRFRDELAQLSRVQSTWLGAALVFVVIYGTVSVLNGPNLFVGYPAWQLYVLLSTLAAAAIFALYRMIRTVLAWRTVRFRCHANIAIGHQLQRLASQHGRAYHDIPTSAGVVDHVLIGQSGIYAINVVARRRFRKGAAFLDGNRLHFSNTDRTQSLVNILATTKRVEKEFRRVTGKDINVRSVIAVPGWDIKEQFGNDNLLVNERTLSMLRGWKDRSDHLLNEDVVALQNDLTSRCRIKPV